MRMIERQFVTQKKKEFEIQKYVMDSLKRAGLSRVKIQRTPLGERIIVFTSRPGLVVGRGGNNIKKLTGDLKSRFKLENPQIEISEVKEVNLDARIVAERIAASLEKYGSKRFKAILHKAMEDVTKAGALGVEIILSGKIPSARARSWRVYSGYLRKCGEGAIDGIDRAITQAKLKSGIIGIKVNITPPDIILADKVTLKSEDSDKKTENEGDKADKTEEKDSENKETESKDKDKQEAENKESENRESEKPEEAKKKKKSTHKSPSKTKKKTTKKTKTKSK